MDSRSTDGVTLIKFAAHFKLIYIKSKKIKHEIFFQKPTSFS